MHQQSFIFLRMSDANRCSDLVTALDVLYITINQDFVKQNNYFKEGEYVSN